MVVLSFNESLWSLQETDETKRLSGKAKWLKHKTDCGTETRSDRAAGLEASVAAVAEAGEL